MKTSEQSDKIYAAIFAVKKELVAVAKSSDNPFFKSKYADLNTHLDEVEPRLAKVGCMLLQPVNADNTVESRIVHVESGQWISSEMPLIVAKNTMQDAGSAVTYARRYTLGSLLSMKAEDDDGEKSMARPTQTKTYQANSYTEKAASKVQTTAEKLVELAQKVDSGVVELPKKSSSFKKKSTVTSENKVTAEGDGTSKFPPVSTAKDGWQ